MLIQFAVENFLSFRKKTVFSMAASQDQCHQEQVSTTPSGFRIVRCAALYGANSSGKSNLVKALAFARELITEGTRPGGKIRITPFKLQSELARECRFEFEVLSGGYQFSYGFIVSSTEIRAEWLYRTRDAHEEMCFERTVPAGEKQEARIQLGDIFGEDRPRVEFVSQGTRPEQLFLTEAAERNVSALKPLFSWFQTRLTIIRPQSKFWTLITDAENSPDFLAFLVGHLQTAGTGISGLTTRRSSLESIPEPVRNELMESLKDGGATAAQVHPLDGVVVKGKEEGTLEQIRLITQRTLADGSVVNFELREESDGTRRLLDLAPALFLHSSSQEDTRPVFVIDELERSLHPLMTRRFLQSYLSAKCAGGQMIVTTHDTNLLDLELLRADEIWFIEKDDAHVSSLYSLAEFQPDQLQKLGSHLEEGYLNGRFGAIPFFGKPKQLGIMHKA